MLKINYPLRHRVLKIEEKVFIKTRQSLRVVDVTFAYPYRDT